MFEGIINLQLPFMLISSGISSVLYLIFLFINITYPKPEEIATNDHKITVEENQQIVTRTNDSDFDYSDYFKHKDFTQAQTLEVENNFCLHLLTIRLCDLKYIYSCPFAKVNFARPPPIIIS
jgi:hypothetical protein